MTSGSTSSGGPARLTDFDKRSKALRRICTLLSWVWPVAVVASAVVPPFYLRTWAATIDTAAIYTVGGSVMGAAAGLGGLAATLFFLTAQLRVSGIAQTGIGDIYKVRLILPLLASTAGLMLLGGTMLLLAESQLRSARVMAIVAVFELIPFLIAVSHLALLTLLYLDPIAVGRKFSTALRYEDVAQWRLLKLDIRAADSDPFNSALEVSCVVQSHRMNFGLRDPLMPIQELVERAENKQFGRLVSLPLERVASDYGIPWEAQAPDPEEWLDDTVVPLNRFQIRYRRLTKRVARDAAYGKSGIDARVASETAAAFRRLSLLLLVLHWCRRLPGNNKVKNIPPDVRRQQTQFLVCRLAVLLIRADPRTSHAASLSEAELKAAAVLCVYVVAGLSSQFRGVQRSGSMEPAWALFAVAQALYDRGWEPEFEFTIETLAWIHRHTPHVDGSWDRAFASDAPATEAHRFTLAALRRASRKRSRDEYPTVGSIPDPWLPWKSRRD